MIMQYCKKRFAQKSWIEPKIKLNSYNSIFLVQLLPEKTGIKKSKYPITRLFSNMGGTSPPVEKWRREPPQL